MSEEQKPEDKKPIKCLKTLDEILSDSREIRVADQMITVDPKRLEFNEASLSKYQETESAWYDYFGQRFADAEAEAVHFELKYEQLYHAKFAKLKEEGGSDKLVEAKVKSDPDVVEARSHCAVARHKVRILQQHLRAWDKNHDNSQSRGHMIRKELDKLHQELLRPNNSVEDEFERIVGGTSNG